MKKNKNTVFHIDKKFPGSIFLFFILFISVLLVNTGCNTSTNKNESDQINAKVVCSPDNGGITLPDGFCAAIVTDSLGPIRHIAVAPNGDIYVRSRNKEGGIIALRDTNGDFHADIIKRFGDTTVSRGYPWETGVAVHNGFLWASNTVAVYRWPMPTDGSLVPTGKPDTVVSGFPLQFTHASKSFTFDDSGHIYVAVGAPSNACQVEEREGKSPGIDPCPLLELHGGIWRFYADSLGQKQQDGIRYATGLRNVVGLDWNFVDHALYVTQHGRDQLHQLWPELYTDEESAEQPAEEMLRITEGADAGWPYSYYDWKQKKKLLAPEYGGDGHKVARSANYVDPVVAFPGHWAPDDLLFYTAKQFPEHYQGGAFIAFHGSWNRAPLPQGGYNVCFVPFKDGKAIGNYETFADGFMGKDTILSPGDAKYRPVGLALGPDGTLYIADSEKGRIWRVVYTGKTTQSAVTKDVQKTEATGVSQVNAATTSSLSGEALFQKIGCQTCHTIDPNKPASTGPNLYNLYGKKVTLQDGSSVTADEAYLRESILQARVKIVEGYMPVMPSYEGQLTKGEVNKLVSYISTLQSRG